MNTPQNGLRVASVLFSLVGLAHLLRLLGRVQILVAGQTIPVWLSLPALLACAGLALWLWRLSGSGSPPPPAA